MPKLIRFIMLAAVTILLLVVFVFPFNLHVRIISTMFSIFFIYVALFKPNIFEKF
ncbi:hypothetical protein Thena_0897 [Thermodesulfobium narugense DSM 14796]|uniref:Uncharacterized protein n=1 Tax=Thermodesulfobium narugense DSM 14796 TaxID=747365 RepID=M1E5W6_9BACT|nr:hypothetical protein [Thermodesulfobium narugense]AEE14526.1 hypothetical protein Thena_0897 [Thermodesulfobium narugense DSM 14796]